MGLGRFLFAMDLSLPKNWVPVVMAGLLLLVTLLALQGFNRHRGSVEDDRDFGVSGLM